MAQELPTLNHFANLFGTVHVALPHGDMQPSIIDLSAWCMRMVHQQEAEIYELFTQIRINSYVPSVKISL